MPVPSPEKWGFAAGRASGVKLFFQNIMIRYDDESIHNRSRPRLPTTASSVARQGSCEKYATAGRSKIKRKKRGGRRVKRQRKLWKGRRRLIRVCTLSIGTMTGRAPCPYLQAAETSPG